MGSPLYMAPEIIKRVPYDEKVDIWSLGVIIYILLSGRPPFAGRTKQEIFLHVTTQPIEFEDNIWSKVSKEAKSFLKLMLVRDPRKRSPASELLKHEWIT